ncbi:MAG: tRNA uracil 4-sulfurtransferase ThiI [Clostridia bacterium]
MQDVIIARFAEVHLKGKNRGIFIKCLFDNLKDNLKEFDLDVKMLFNRFVISNYNARDDQDIVRIVKYTAGVSSLSHAKMLPTSQTEIDNYVATLKLDGTFKVEVNRADKTFPVRSSDYAADLGEIVLRNNPKASVRMKNPDQTLKVDIREDGVSFIYFEDIEGVGGLPLERKTNGLLLLSGGIDSPVAGFCMGRRGLRQDILHFNSYPYTSPLAKDKVIKLAKLVKPYIGARRMYIVSMTKMQEAFRKHCQDEYAVTLLRRNMYRVAERISNMYDYKAIVTGENLGQVASQTLEGLTVSQSALVRTLALRPLISFNKLDTIKIAEEIGTYETSILPYEDCCTVFLPKKPAIKPKVEIIDKEESKIDLETLLQETLNNIEIIEL